MICFALNCSASDGTLTSHDKNARSSMMADHCDVSQLISRELVRAAHGWLCAVSDFGTGETCSLPAEEHDDSVALCWDEAQHEDILASTIVACGVSQRAGRTRIRLTFGNSVSESAIPMQYHLFVLRFDQMVDDVRCRGVAPGIAEPLSARQAFDNALRIVYAAVAV